MANTKQRYINTKIWNDSYVSELDLVEKLLFIYLLTNEHTNISGIYELPLKIIATETGMDKNILEKSLPKLKDKIGYVKGYVVIKNFVKHQETRSDLVKKGIINCLKDIDLDFLKILIEKGIYCLDKYYLDTLCIPYPKVLNYLDSNLDLDSNNTTHATKVASLPKKDKKNTKVDDNDPMTLEQFCEWMRKSTQPHIQWMADYAEEKKPRLETKGQWRDFFSRNVKAAAQIRKYSDDQISEAFDMVQENLKTKKNPKGYITKWGIETIIKFLDEITQK